MSQSTADSARAVLDVATGATVAGMRRALQLTRRPAGRLLPVARRAAEVGAATAPQGVVDAVGRLRREGRSTQERVRRRAVQLFDASVPVVLDAVLDQVDLTALVLRRVDLDAIAAALDLDAAAAGLDIDEILDRIDFDAVIADRVDIDGVAAGLDIDKVLDRVDFDAVVAQRVNLIGLAEYVVDGIDLPRIIRESTGSVASESLRGVRTRSMDADQALAALVDRMLLRRRTGRDRANQNAHQNAHQNGSAGAPAVHPEAPPGRWRC